MEYDSLFKQLLKTFFRSFMELFFPEVAVRIQWNSIEFVDKEEQGQAAEGSSEHQSFHRSADIVVKVATLDESEELILIHVEVENPWRSTFPFRMFEYFALLRLSHRLPIFPIAILPERRIKPFEVETYSEELFGHKMLTYSYFHIGLPGLFIDNYWSDENPVSWAFSAFMNQRDRDKVPLMAQCYRRIYEGSLSDNEKILLLDFIRTYYQLTPDEDTAFQNLLRQETYREAKEMELILVTQGMRDADYDCTHRGQIPLNPCPAWLREPFNGVKIA